MPELNLVLPKNSLFNSSLNEIDCILGQMLVEKMRIVDPRNILGKQSISADPEKNDWLWDASRVFQVDELTTEEIFDTYLLRKKINNKKGVDVSYPILAYLQNDINTVFWANAGTRFKQWFLETTSGINDRLDVGDEVVILQPFEYRGTKATIFEVIEDTGVRSFKLNVNGALLQKRLPNLKYVPLLFTEEHLRATNQKAPQTFKAKPITLTYTVSILIDNRDEAQYLRDTIIMNLLDQHIWLKYNSYVLNGSENQIFTVFGIPNLDKIPSSADKIKGEGYIYSITFNIDVWACLTNKPLPAGFIETIRMNLHVEGDGRTNRIVITE